MLSCHSNLLLFLFIIYNLAIFGLLSLDAQYSLKERLRTSSWWAIYCLVAWLGTGLFMRHHAGTIGFWILVHISLQLLLWGLLRDVLLPYRFNLDYFACFLSRCFNTYHGLFKGDRPWIEIHLTSVGFNILVTRCSLHIVWNDWYLSQRLWLLGLVGNLQAVVRTVSSTFEISRAFRMASERHKPYQLCHFWRCVQAWVCHLLRALHFLISLLKLLLL